MAGSGAACWTWWSEVLWVLVGGHRGRETTTARIRAEYPGSTMASNLVTRFRHGGQQGLDLAAARAHRRAFRAAARADEAVLTLSAGNFDDAIAKHPIILVEFYSPCRGQLTEVMEGNKDEALRSVKLAQAALASGDRKRADKFIQIAQRLDPSLPIADLLTTTKKFDPLNGTSYQGKNKRGQVRENLKTQQECGPSSVDKGYTEENVRVVRDIRKNKDYYAILGVERSCSLEEIRKAYRRLSLKIHPDKNKAPGAEDAFKIVSKAFKCLGNDQSRRTYDQTGALEGHDFNDQYSNVMRQRTPRRRQTRNSFYNYEEDLDPDEIFRSFFYGTHDNSFRTHNAYRARGTSRQEQQRREHPVQGGSVINLTVLMHFAVILLFVLFAFIPVWQPEYSLQKTYNYPMSKVTQKHGVEYFVSKQDFDLQFPRGSASRDNLEEQVFRDYKNMLGRNCRVELHRRKWAKDYPTPHCDKLRSLAVP